MFTGIIQGVGRLAARETLGGDERFHIHYAPLPWNDLTQGESISVNGACLTVVNFDPQVFQADVSRETLDLTTLGRLNSGAAVNLERAMSPSSRFGGHMVSGHVDGIGRILSVQPDARAQRWRFTAPTDLLPLLARKGSVCINGVSLTLNAVDAQGFEVALIPHTLDQTNFASLVEGDWVNLEVDLIARYVQRLMQCQARG